MLGSLTQQQMEEVMIRNVTGRIGCYDGKRTYIVPVNYAYNEKDVIIHSREGMKINIMRSNPQVCFQVDELKALNNWKSVIAWGVYEEITDEKEKYYAMKFLVSRLMHLAVSETANLPHMQGDNGSDSYKPEVIRPVVYRIKVEEKTGRFESN
jgi:uncharacterized protein